MSETKSTTASYASLNAMLPLLEHLGSEGIDLAALLEHAGIPGSVLGNVRIRLPQAKLEALWQAAAGATGDPAIALRVATRARPSTLGVIGYLASASESGRNAFELVKGLVPLLWEDLECELESDPEVAFLRFRTGSGAAVSRFTAEYAVGLAVTMSRALSTVRSGPLEARFSHSRPAHAPECERILGLPVRFDAREDGVLFPTELMDSSNPSADAALRHLLERHAADQLARIMSSSPFSRRIRACIPSMLSMGNLTADALAARFCMSGRSLRRRLREEGTSYQEILDEVRAELARRYLGREGRAVDEVSFLLGFSDPSAFTKAFRRWTGQKPGDYVRSRSA